MNIYLIDFENVGETSLNGIEDLNPDDKVYIFYSNKIKINLFSRAEIGFINTNKPANISENQKRNYLDFQLATFLGFLISNKNECNYHIISKDQGYISLINFWKNKNKIYINQQQSIKQEIIKTNNEQNKTSSLKLQNNKSNSTKSSENISNTTNKPTTDKANNNNKQQKSDNKSVKNTSISETIPNEWKKKIRDINKKCNLELKDNEFRVVYKVFIASSNKDNFLKNLKNTLKKNKVSSVYENLSPIFEEYIVKIASENK